MTIKQCKRLPISRFKTDFFSRATGIMLKLTLLLALSSAFSPLSIAACAVNNIPHITGEWRTIPYLMPVNPVSATLLNNGKILIVSGSEYDPQNNSEGSEGYRIAIWDPTNPSEDGITVHNVEYDVFCSGTSIQADGRPFVVGGTSEYVLYDSNYSFTGNSSSSIFDPVTEEFLQTQSMADGRWYGTVTELGDGRMMAFSGLGSNGFTNNTTEIYNTMFPGNGWTTPITSPFGPSTFPRMLLLPNGKVFYTGQGFEYFPGLSWIFDPVAGTWAQSAPTTMDRHNGSAVLLPLLPPKYTPSVMNFGGGSPATNTTEIINLSAASPSWVPGPNMSTGRIQMNAVLLPNGKVLAEGGSLTNEVPDDAGRTADIYDPAKNTLSSGGTAAFSRLYHSTALLLPDATVMSIGSNPGAFGTFEPAIEIYRPAYLFNAQDQLITSRPIITNISSKVIGYGAPFNVAYKSASPITSAVLIHPGSVTHAFDMAQRLIGLCGPKPQPPCKGGSNTLSLISPPNGNIAPPGYYMLFLLNSSGVPSVAKFIQLSTLTSPPPTGTITSPASDTTVTVGQPVYFDTNTTAANYSWIFPGGTPSQSTAHTPGAVTFNTAGTYVASLTVSDSSGNTDPSPPRRTITVLQNPDFEINVTPAQSTILPGGSAVYTVTVTPLSGFNGTVNLNVETYAALPWGVSYNFNPVTITGGGTSTLTVDSTIYSPPEATSLTITGTSGTIEHIAATTLLVNMPAPANLIATGGNSQVSLSWTGSPRAVNFHVKRALTSGGPYVPVGCTTSSSYTDTGLTNNITYYYVVTAEYSNGDSSNGPGESFNSSEVSATTVGPTKRNH